MSKKDMYNNKSSFQMKLGINCEIEKEKKQSYLWNRGDINQEIKKIKVPLLEAL